MVEAEADFWRGKRVFLTGHSGFKGAWMVLVLRRLGARVHGYSLHPAYTPTMFGVLGLESACDVHRVADIRDRAALEAAMCEARPDVAIHMAAQPIVSTSYVEPVETFATNVMGTAHFLEACRVAGPPLALVISSDKCYRNEGTARALREDDPLGGNDPYSASKAATELVVTSWRYAFLPAEGAVRLASARAGNVIGGGDWSVDRLLPDAARAFADGRPLLIRNPDAVRPWQHVLEPVVGYLRLIRHLADHSEAARGWNFGPPLAEVRSVREIADMAASAWPGGPGWIAPEDYVRRFSEATTLMLDSSDIERAIGWRSRLTTEEAVRWTMEWYHAHHRGGGEAARRVGEEQLTRYLARSES